MTLKSDTNRIEELIGYLKTPWAYSGTADEHFEEIRQQLLLMANDRADAREMLDQAKIKVDQLSRALSSSMDFVVSLKRRQANIKMLVESLAAPAHVRLDAIRRMLEADE